MAVGVAVFGVDVIGGRSGFGSSAGARRWSGSAGIVGWDVL